jgi:hypothetical protein
MGYLDCDSCTINCFDTCFGCIMVVRNMKSYAKYKLIGNIDIWEIYVGWITLVRNVKLYAKCTLLK